MLVQKYSGKIADLHKRTFFKIKNQGYIFWPFPHPTWWGGGKLYVQIEKRKEFERGLSKKRREKERKEEKRKE